MKKKKTLWVILLLIIILIVILLGLTIRKMIIISQIENKISNYINKTNYHISSYSHYGNTQTIIDYYTKEKKAKLTLISKVNEEERKLINFFEGDKTNTYIESNGEKIAILDSNGLPSKMTIVNPTAYNNNVWDLFTYCFGISVHSTKLNEKDCYLVKMGKDSEMYLEKDTGLMIKNKSGTNIDENGNQSSILTEFKYEFDKVSDADLTKPNLADYKIQEYNT